MMRRTLIIVVTAAAAALGGVWAGLAIVELDAEDGARMKEGQVLARLDRTQLDALMAQNDASTKRADAAIDQAGRLIAQSAAQVQFSNADFERAHKLEAGIMSASSG